MRKSVVHYAVHTRHVPQGNDQVIVACGRVFPAIESPVTHYSPSLLKVTCKQCRRKLGKEVK